MSTLPLKRLMNQTIGLSRQVTDDNTPYHEKIYTGVSVYPARVEISPGRAFGRNGEEVSTYATIYTTAEVGVMDRVTLPDGSIRQVISVSKQVGRDGKFSHSEVRV